MDAGSRVARLLRTRTSIAPRRSTLTASVAPQKLVDLVRRSEFTLRALTVIHRGQHGAKVPAVTHPRAVPVPAQYLSALTSDRLINLTGNRARGPTRLRNLYLQTKFVTSLRFTGYLVYRIASCPKCSTSRRAQLESPKTPRSSDIRKFQNRDVDVGLHQRNSGSALPMFLQSVSRGWKNFEASTVRPFATACQVARRPVRIWRVSQPTAPFTSRLSAARSPSPLLDMTTASTGLLCWRDFHPLE
jgi:hypothetical protein